MQKKNYHMRVQLLLASQTQTLEQWVTLPLSSVFLAIFCRCILIQITAQYFMLHQQIH